MKNNDEKLSTVKLFYDYIMYFVTRYPNHGDND